MLLARPCKTCGQPINSFDKRQVRCQLNCPGMKVEVSCCICGKAKEVYKSQIKENHCCSLECQRHFALVDNRGITKPNWTARSKEAKKNWKKQEEKRRRCSSKKFRFWKISKASSQYIRTKQPTEWQKRCFSASQTSHKRFYYLRQDDELQPTTWKEAVDRGIKSLTASSRKSNKWKVKCNQVSKNMVVKRLLRNDKENASKPTERQGQQERQRYLWE